MGIGHMVIKDFSCSGMGFDLMNNYILEWLVTNLCPKVLVGFVTLVPIFSAETLNYIGTVAINMYRVSFRQCSAYTGLFECFD